MSSPLLSSEKGNQSQFDHLSTNADQTFADLHADTHKEGQWPGLTREERKSLLSTLHRIGLRWIQTVYTRVRLIVTLVAVTMLNIATRFTHLARQKTSLPSAAPLSTMTSLPLNRTVEGDFRRSSDSCLLLDTSDRTQVELPPFLESTNMARILMHPPTHRSASIHICPTKSASSDNLLPMAHSVDEALFLSKQHPTTSFFQLWQRFTSEPHISENHSRSLPGTNYLSDQFFEKKPFLDPSQWSMSKSASPVTDAKVEDIEFNCDLIEPVTPEDPVRYDDLIGPVDSSSKDACSSDRSDTIIPIDMTIIDEPKGEEFDTDALSSTASSNNIDRHFRRRKRRSSLTRLSTSSDDSPTVTPDIPSTPTDINNNRQQAKSTEVVEHTEPVPLDSLSSNTKPEETPIENIDSSESASPVGRYRARRLRHRFYRRPCTITEELTADIPVQFYVPTEPAPSPSAVFTPPPSPPSPVSPAATSPTRSTGSLKRTGSLGTTKKMVRFADSVGRELTQVQYIDSMTNGESKGSAFARKNLYGSHLSSTDLKPWSFDVAQSSRFMFDQPKPKRFFCLYRQPNSEHPDIYLHEVWRSQIKLEYADIRVKPSSTSGEQSLQGTLWVTNASYYKHVTVKYTFNHWINTCECEAQYRCHSNDFRNIDQFDFSIDVPSDVDRIDFVLRYCVNGQEHWDNNDGKNYTLQSESASIPQTTISLPHDCDFNEMRFY